MSGTAAPRFVESSVTREDRAAEFAESVSHRVTDLSTRDGELAFDVLAFDRHRARLNGKDLEGGFSDFPTSPSKSLPGAPTSVDRIGVEKAVNWVELIQSLSRATKKAKIPRLVNSRLILNEYDAISNQ